MKQTLIMLILLIMISCESKDIILDCGCEKLTYYYKDNSTQYIEIIDTYVISVDDIDCAEQTFKTPTEQPNIFYNIRCIK